MNCANVSRETIIFLSTEKVEKIYNNFIFLFICPIFNIILNVSLKPGFIIFDVCSLNAKVVVEHIYGIFNFLANSFPQRLKESDTIQSGLNFVNSSQTCLSSAKVVSTIIFIKSGKSLPTLFSSSTFNSGKYSSQQIHFAPV